MDPRDLLAAADLPIHEAERLLLTVTGRTRVDLYTADVTESDASRYRILVEQRRRGVPLQHLEETIPFGPVTVRVDRRALIPRPETELLFDEAASTLGRAGPGSTIVDLGTGTGALALALRHRFPEARVIATDVSPEALSLAAENAERNRMEIELFEGDLFDALPDGVKGRIDLLVANPPYVAEHEYALLPAEIRDYEPRLALVGGERGVEVLERIAEEVYWWLAEGGWLFCEIGETQAEQALELFSPWLFCEIRDDLAGRPRIVVGRKGAACC